MIVLAGAVFLVVQTLILHSDSHEMMPVFGLVSAITQFGLVLMGIIFGIIGAASRDRPKFAAGIGIGIAASVLFSMLASTLSSAIIFAL